MADTKTDALDLATEVWRRFRSRMDGLTDEEYRWEPAPNCWTVRPDGDGTMRADRGLVFDEDEPLTTIVWRLWHIIEVLAAPRCATWLGLEPTADLLTAGPPGTASEALDLLDAAYPLWRGYVEQMDEEGLREMMGPVAGPYADNDRAGFVWHILDELIHHAAEVSLLRDLHRATRPKDAFVTAALAADGAAVEAMRRDDPTVVERVKDGHPDLMRTAAAYGCWDAVRLLMDLGFPIDSADGRSAVHHAAAHGRLDVMQALIERGADLSARDPVYDSTPLGWAEYFGRSEAAEYLRSIQPVGGG